MTTTKRRRTTKQKPNQPESPHIIEWRFQEGPPQRSLRWYGGVLAIGLIIGSFLTLVDPGGFTAALSAVIWVCVLFGLALAPRADYIGQLDGNLLAIYTAKRHHLRLERNLSEFASWRLEVIWADRLNPTRQWLVLQRRDGRGSVEIKLPSDGRITVQILERVSKVVARAPEIAPSPIDQFFAFAQRWIGWWR